MSGGADTEGAGGGGQPVRAVRTEHGVVLAFVAVVQCLGCNSVLEHKVENEHPEDLDHLVEQGVQCPVCSEREGADVVIPVVVLAGDQVDEELEEVPEGEEDEGEGEPLADYGGPDADGDEGDDSDGVPS